MRSPERAEKIVSSLEQDMEILQRDFGISPIENERTAEKFKEAHV